MAKLVVATVPALAVAAARAKGRIFSAVLVLLYFKNDWALSRAVMDSPLKWLSRRSWKVIPPNIWKQFTGRSGWLLYG